MQYVLLLVLDQGAQCRVHDGLGKTGRARRIEHIERMGWRELLEFQGLGGRAAGGASVIALRRLSARPFFCGAWPLTYVKSPHIRRRQRHLRILDPPVSNEHLGCS